MMSILYLGAVVDKGSGIWLSKIERQNKGIIVFLSFRSLLMNEGRMRPGRWMIFIGCGTNCC